jgi:hypothetical protein
MPRPAARPAPDHRWHLARKLVPRGKALGPARMAPYAVRVLPGGTRLTGAALVRATAVVREAIELREAEDPAPRDDIEAWLLCGVGPAEVGTKTGVEADVVQSYRDLFFDLTAWLTDEFAREDLAWALLGEKVCVGIEEADVGAWKRFAALNGGPVVLERLLDYLKAVPLVVPSDMTGLSDADLERLRDLLVVRMYVLGKATLRTTAQRLRMEFVYALAEGQRIWPANMR